MKIAIIVSADAEWIVIKSFFSNSYFASSLFGEYTEIRIGNKEVLLFQGGWGKISAAAACQYVIDMHKPDLIMNIGTCGGFSGKIDIGATVLVERTLVYDILEQMGDSESAIEHYSTSLDLSWLPPELPFSVVRGLLISADRDIVTDDVSKLIEKYNAFAADWESGAIAWVSQRNGQRLVILRSVTDLVGTDGGEAYGKIGLFQARTNIEMNKLLTQLPAWLEILE